MDYHRGLVTLLFQSMRKAGNFEDVRFYYFHNAIGDHLYTSPTLSWSSRIETDWVLHNIPPEYKVLIVGDGEMAMYELYGGFYSGRIARNRCAGKAQDAPVHGLRTGIRTSSGSTRRKRRPAAATGTGNMVGTGQGLSDVSADALDGLNAGDPQAAGEQMRVKTLDTACARRNNV